MKNILRDLLLTLFSSFLLILVSYGFGFLIWIAFVPLSIVFYNNKNNFKLAIFFVLLFILVEAPFFYNVVISEAFVFYIGAVLYSFVFFLLLFSLVFLLSRKFEGRMEVFILPLAFMSLFILFGYTKYLNFIVNFSIFQPNMNLILKFVGDYGLLFLIFLFNSAVAFYVIRKDKIYLAFILIILGLIIVSPLYNPEIHPEKSLKVALIQGNFPLSWEWRKSNVGSVFEVYKNMTLEASKFNVDLVVWPEYTLIGDFDYENIKLLSEDINATIILGIANHMNNENFKDSALIVSKGSLLSYNASHVFPGLQDYAVPSKENPKLFNVQGFDFGILICTEETVSHLSRDYGAEDADLIVSLSNNQHFNYKGLMMSSLFTRIASSKTSKYTIRATNNGITQVIDPNGKVIKSLESNKRDYLIATISTNNEKTIYSKYGNFLLYLVLFILFILITSKIIKRN
ncbi:hypothetical protein HYX19_04785 [Candidatus Woesearchaeota archaeon]|nr:hypothetical protein [Candidatus Woesearchaeota archaeon]